ncbi:MAG: cytochrome c oxidase subunit II [Anaerolineaceae bacterium]|nr:cytochrome c oxidase subunit II [Anaerolineaceae bacterium]
MSDSYHGPLHRVLIASANPLFARGLEKMVSQHWQGRGVEIRLAGSTQEALTVLETWLPDLTIVDYDDVVRPGSIQREAFLSHFISGDRPMQVMLVSLSASGEVVVYDRRTLTPAQAEDWLELPWGRQETVEQAVPLSNNQSITRSGGMKHYVIAGVLTVILSILTFLGLQVVVFPVAASVQAGPIDRLADLQLGMISFLFALIVVFIVYSLVVFRQRKGDMGEGSYFKGSTSLEIAWTLIPLATVIILAFLGAQTLGEIRRVDPQAMQINVTAFQWGWIYEYPDFGVQSNTLYMPVDKQVLFSMTSRDVIHSFWVKEFRLKQDILPGKNLVKEMRVTPNRIGEYTVMCAELCGGAHAYMTSPLKVVSQADFDAWIASEQQAANASPVERGQKLSKGTGCEACHSLDGTKLTGPTWKDLAGSQVKLADGSTVTADDAYLVDSITNPNAQVVEGYPPIMPAAYKDTLSEQQIKDIVEFIKTLK